MIIKGIIDEDFVNYKLPAMSIMCPSCTFKCGAAHCQNKSLADEPNISTTASKLCRRYVNNPITKAVVFQGLEPFDSFEDILEFIRVLRNEYGCDDDIVIYTGYDKASVIDKINLISNYKNIVVKFGGYIPGDKPHYDEVLGVSLASDNQYAEVL